MTLDVTEENFSDVAGTGHVLIDVWGPDCVPCMALMPFVESLEQDYADRVAVLKLNAPDHRKLCRELRLAGLPTYITMRDGVEVERVSGPKATQANITAAVERLLDGAPAVGLPVPEHLRTGG